MKNLIKTPLSVTIFLTASLLVEIAIAGMCLVPPERGQWVNSDSNTRNITRLSFQLKCENNGGRKCDGNICQTTSSVKTRYFLHLFGSCSPTDCDWGEVEGIALFGVYKGWYYFYYDHGFAKRYVLARTYPAWPGWLRLRIHTDYTSPSGKDYVSDEWFHPAP